MIRYSTAGVLFGILAGCTLVASNGCTAPTSDYSKNDHALKLSVQPSSRKCMEGETVTFLSRTENTLGRDARLEWTTTGGDDAVLKTEQENRVARVTFKKPGTYSVDGILMADGKEVDRSTTVVTVTPLP